MLSLAFNVLIGLIVLRAVLSWFDPAGRHPIVRGVDRVTEPLLAPIRLVLPPASGVDFSPLVLILLLYLLRSLLGV